MGRGDGHCLCSSVFFTHTLLCVQAVALRTQAAVIRAGDGIFFKLNMAIDFTAARGPPSPPVVDPRAARAALKPVLPLDSASIPEPAARPGAAAGRVASLRTALPVH